MGSFHRPLERSNHVLPFYGFTGGGRARPRVRVSMGRVCMFVFVSVGSFVKRRYALYVNILGESLPAQISKFLCRVVIPIRSFFSSIALFNLIPSGVRGT